MKTVFTLMLIYVALFKGDFDEENRDKFILLMVCLLVLSIVFGLIL